MPYELWLDPGFQRELATLLQAEQDTIKRALAGLLEAPMEHPKVARLHGSSHPGSFGMRVGPVRLLGIAVATADLILMTTLFRKKRDSDYDQALARHDKRIRLQGPSLDEVLRGGRRGETRRKG